MPAAFEGERESSFLLRAEPEGSGTLPSKPVEFVVTVSYEERLCLDTAPGSRAGSGRYAEDTELVRGGEGSEEPKAATGALVQMRAVCILRLQAVIFCSRVEARPKGNFSGDAARESATGQHPVPQGRGRSGQGPFPSTKPSPPHSHHPRDPLFQPSPKQSLPTLRHEKCSGLYGSFHTQGSSPQPQHPPGPAEGLCAGGVPCSVPPHWEGGRVPEKLAAEAGQPHVSILQVPHGRVTPQPLSYSPSSWP